MKLGLIEDMSSEEYHGMAGSYSSSQLKDISEDPEYFHKKYILKEIEREENSVFDIGSFFHTSILEPHKIKSECAVYKGIRRGKEWDAFKEANKGKAIITESESSQAETLVKAVKNSSIAMGRISRGKPEVSAFTELIITGSEIYSPKKLVLGKYGWEKVTSVPNGTKIIVKVRADLLGDSFILDLKSTGGNTKSENAMRQKVSAYNYDLSAALYLDIFSEVTGRDYNEFIWTFASKDWGNSKSYVASSDNIQIGRVKYKKAILNLGNCIKNNWKFEDSLGILNPQMFELEHLKQRAEDLL